MAQKQNVVIGIDTHKDFHVAAGVDELGRVVGTLKFGVNRNGSKTLLAWASSQGELLRAGVEGTGSYGANLCRFLVQADIEVIEVNRPNRQLRRAKGKTDFVDAEAAARVALAYEQPCVPKSQDGYVEAIRALRVARNSAVKARTQVINQIKSLLVNTSEELNIKTRGLNNKKLIGHLGGLRPSNHSVESATKLALRSLAKRAGYLSKEIASLDHELAMLIETNAPRRLLDLPGVGIDVAGALLVAVGDNPERMRSESSFAALCGVSPVCASSGKTQRVRLNRGGNREANKALWRIAMVRLSHDQRTKDYIAKKTTEGKSNKEAIRCLKRYLAREVYSTLVQSTPGEWLVAA